MLLALLLVQAAPSVGGLVASHQALTRAEVKCRTPADAGEILICGRREADRRYRVTFVTTDPRDSVRVERSRLLETKLSTCGRVGMSFAECGFVGVAMSTNGVGPVRVKPRPLAP